MIPESELARALARWKARKLGLPVTTSVGGESAEMPQPVFEENTRVAPVQYHAEVETPQAEVHLIDGDYEEDHNTRR